MPAPTAASARVRVPMRARCVCRNTPEAGRWPGNIRELRNVVELLLAEGKVGAEDVRSALPALENKAVAISRTDGDANGPLAQRVLAFERAQVLKALERHGRQIRQTAKALGLDRSHLYKKFQQLGIDLKELPARD